MIHLGTSPSNSKSIVVIFGTVFTGLQLMITGSPTFILPCLE